MGIDVAEENVRLTITSGQGTSGTKPFLITQEGESVVTAIESMQEYSQRDDMFYAHVQYAVLGQASAMEGISRFLDYFERAPYVRLDIGMFVVHEATAEELISKSSSETTDITEYLSELERMTETTGISKIFSAKDISRSLSEKGSALISAVKIVETEGVVLSETSEVVAEPIGFGVLRGEKLVGFILDEAAKGVSILLGETEIGNLVIETDRQYTVSIESHGAKLSPKFTTEGKLAEILVECEISGSVSEIGSTSPNFTAKSVEELELAISENISGLIRKGLASQGEFGVDFLGISGEFGMELAKFVEEMPEAEISVTVNSKIDKTADMRVPTEPEEGKP